VNITLHPEVGYIINGGVGRFPKHEKDGFPWVLPFVWIEARAYCLSIINPYNGFNDSREMMVYITVCKKKKRIKERRMAFLCLKRITSIYNIRRVVSFL
jgi:hypothetical protein